MVARTDDCTVTLLAAAQVGRAVLIDDTIALEDGAPIVWFTFPGAWHDIGRFHRVDGTFTGVYANVLTPVASRDDDVWVTTDLFLDVWRSRDGAVRILDEDEFEHARLAGWIDADLASAARAEADRIADAARAGDWPPPIVGHWTLERVRALLAVR